MHALTVYVFISEKWRIHAIIMAYLYLKKMVPTMSKIPEFYRTVGTFGHHHVMYTWTTNTDTHAILISLWGSSINFYEHNANPSYDNLNTHPVLTLTINDPVQYNTFGIFSFLTKNCPHSN